jgi:hypothetical protein
MKHLLNDLSEEEKNRIREQHTGGKKIMIENFNQLLNKKLGEVKPLINEQTNSRLQSGKTYKMKRDVDNQVYNVTINKIQKNAADNTKIDWLLARIKCDNCEGKYDGKELNSEFELKVKGNGNILYGNSLLGEFELLQNQ